MERPGSPSTTPTGLAHPTVTTGHSTRPTMGSVHKLITRVNIDDSFGYRPGPLPLT